MKHGQRNISNQVEMDCNQGHVSKGAKQAVIIDFQKIRALKKNHLSITTLDTNSREAA